MTENWIVRTSRKLLSVGQVVEWDGRRSSSEDDADARRMRSEFAAIRARFPDRS